MRFCCMVEVCEKAEKMGEFLPSLFPKHMRYCKMYRGLYICISVLLRTVKLSCVSFKGDNAEEEFCVRRCLACLCIIINITQPENRYMKYICLFWLLAGDTKVIFRHLHSMAQNSSFNPCLYHSRGTLYHRHSVDIEILLTLSKLGKPLLLEGNFIKSPVCISLSTYQAARLTLLIYRATH